MVGIRTLSEIEARIGIIRDAMSYAAVIAVIACGS
jgi:hypothetical protein